MASRLLRVPSLQQVIKNLYDKPEFVQRALVNSALHPPRTSYKALHKATQDRVCLDVPLNQIVIGIRWVETRPNFVENLIEVMKLIDGHFDGLAPDFPPIEVECRYYPIAPGIRIPFQPPICYGVGGQLYLPYFNFWRNSPLKGKRLSVFMTIMDALRKQEPDIERAVANILDFSIPPNETKRNLVEIDEKDVERVSSMELTNWLQVFAEGYRGAREQLAGMKPEKSRDQKEERRPDEGQDDLFGGKPDA